MVRVVIERHLKAGKEKELMPLLRELRAAAMHQPGYITGETLASTEDSSVITVISTWHNLESWKAWGKSQARVKLYRTIATLLVEEPKVSTYEVMATEKA